MSSYQIQRMCDEVVIAYQKTRLGIPGDAIVSSISNIPVYFCLL